VASRTLPYSCRGMRRTGTLRTWSGRSYTNWSTSGAVTQQVAAWRGSQVPFIGSIRWFGLRGVGLRWKPSAPAMTRCSDTQRLSLTPTNWSRSRSSVDRPQIAAPGVANRTDLAARVNAVLNGEQRRRLAGRVSLAAACAAGGGACLVVVALTLVALPQGAQPAFEVTSVKPNRGGDRAVPFLNESMNWPNGRCSADPTQFGRPLARSQCSTPVPRVSRP
jgi:hypothetical protein